MPARSASQQRLFGMVHAYQKGKLRHAPKRIRELAGRISEEDARDFAKTKHDGLPERKDREEEKAAAYVAGFFSMLKAAGAREEYVSGSGKVESYTPGKTEGHDEIVLRLGDGRRVRISNNTDLGVKVEPAEGDSVNYHGYRVKGTNVVHKVHPNRRQRGGWLEHVKATKAYEAPWAIDRIRRELGDETADRLKKDPVHKWRSDTGIELVHREPTRKELKRIIANWDLMTDEQKRLSDEKSKELFGVTNKENADRLLREYARLTAARRFVSDVRKMALRKKLNFFLVTDGASGISNNGNPAVRNAREAQIKWELEHGSDPYEDWSKKAESKPMTPEELKRLYLKLKYRVLNKDTNRPYFNTDFDTFDNWHLLSPEQIKKHRIGICYDTAAMTDRELSRLGIPHENYFAHTSTDGDWTNDPTHSFNVYKDDDGEWKWLEGSWGPYKDNDWHDRRKRRLVRRIVKELRAAAGKPQRLHKVDRFPEPGIAMKDWYDEMLKMPVKKAQADDETRMIVSKAILAHWKRRHPWGLRLRSGKFIGNDYFRSRDMEDFDDEHRRRLMENGVVYTGDKAVRANRGICHDLASARLKMLADRGVEANRLYVDYESPDNPGNVLNHSMLFYKDRNGRYHHANRHIDEPGRLGDYKDMDEAVRDFIKDVIKSREARRGEPISVYDTTDVDMPESLPLGEYIRLSKEKGRKVYEQGHGKKAQ